MSLLLSIALGLATFGAQAQTAEDYMASAVVLDQSVASRDKGLRDSLSIVLGRAGGAQATPAKIASLLVKPDLLLRQFGYSNNEKGELLINAAFDSAAVDAALKAKGLAVWGISAGPVDEVTVSVSGINSPRAYARALSYLRAQPGVKNVAVTVLANNTLVLRVRNEGGAARLSGAISVGGVLKRLDNGEALAYTLQN